jgi:autotransporter translocation and assembly factor TamB
VSAGKYISDTVYLEVEQGLGPDSGKASVQWEVTPNITVETEAGVNAEGGAGVSWKWDY